MKEKLIRFMQGRNGADTLSKVLLVAGLVAVFLSALLTGSFAYAENEAFLAGVYKIRNFFRSQKGLWKQRKVYHIYKCPGCRQKIRIPKGKGKIEIRCPKCGTTFIKKS